MLINALNSGARVFMADLEDSLSPTWANVVGGQAALARCRPADAHLRLARGQVLPARGAHGDARVRPRGWHLVESGLLVDGVPVSASLFDFGLYLFHNGAESLARRERAILYLAKLENRITRPISGTRSSSTPRRRSGIPRGSIRATVLIETLPGRLSMNDLL